MGATRTLLAAACLGVLGAVPAQAKHDPAKPKEAVAAVSVLSAEDKQHLLNDQFTVVKIVQAIPKPVLDRLLGKGPLDGMADAGQPFQFSDVLRGNLPFRRLVFAAVSPGYCLIYNEHGGYSPYMEMSLYRLSGGQAPMVWRGRPRGSSFGSNLSLPQLQSKIREGKYYSMQLPSEAQKP